MIRRLLVVTAIFAALSVPAFAHHTFAMFDRSRMVKLDGTVKKFTVVNPHSWLTFVAMGTDGQPHSWSLEFGGPNAVARLGLRADSFKPGDKVTLIYYPLRDDSRGGQFAGAVLADGQKFGKTE